MSTDSNSVALIVERNEFYKRIYHNIIITVITIIFTICLLVGFLNYQKRTFAVPKYFPTTPDGVVINSPPDNVNHLLLEKLHFNEQGVLLEWPEINANNLDLQAADSNENAILIFWVTRAIIAMFDLDYINYRSVLQDVRQYFTPKGYEKFLEALNDSKNLDTIKKGKRIAFATLRGKAKATKVGIIEGHMVWSVAVPIIVTYDGNDKEALTQELLAEIKVARVSTLQSSFYGLAIYQINFKVSS